jgi:amino acid adenylation domain-containing protein
MEELEKITIDQRASDMTDKPKSTCMKESAGKMNLNAGAISKENWREYVSGGPTMFPDKPTSPGQLEADGLAECEIPLSRDDHNGADVPTLACAALTLLVARYSGSTDVAFSATISRRDTLSPDVESANNSISIKVPVRVKVDSEQSVQSFIDQVQRQVAITVPCGHLGFHDKTKSDDSGQRCYSLETLLVIEQTDNRSMQDKRYSEDWPHQKEGSEQSFATHLQTIKCVQEEDVLRLRARFDPRVTEAWKIETFVRQLSAVMNRLVEQEMNSGHEHALGEISLLSNSDVARYLEWNRSTPRVVERCVHDMISEKAQEQPNKIALCGWDGELTYGELNAMSNGLATHLVDLGVEVEKVVPLCFEKSIWTVVAILGILKAGAAFVLLDPTLPAQRLRVLCESVKACIAMTSTSCSSTLEGIVKHVLTFGRHATYAYTSLIPPPTPVKPENLAYVIFTSGSTGEPKGCQIEHRSSCTAALNSGPYMNLDSNSRTLQYGSYIFAGAMVEILVTLIQGGCLCIPADQERGEELSQAIRRMDVNWAFLPSTVLSFLQAEAVPSLKTVCVGGEPIWKSQITQWASKVHLRQIYGSAEISGVMSSARLSEESSTSFVGKATTGRYWIVNPENIEELSPLGCPGELVVEGAVVGRGYVGDPEKASAAFVQRPRWRGLIGTCGTGSRFYRTGDLAVYRRDGSIDLLGRNDMQVKLRGQRIELGEIEHQIRAASKQVYDVAVELVQLKSSGVGAPKPGLLGFVALHEAPETCAETEEKKPRQIRDILKAVMEQLGANLPRYMIPSALLQIVSLPRTPSGKVDRRRLRELGGALTAERLAELRTAVTGTMTRQPHTEAEWSMRKIWADALEVEAKSIGVDDSFFHLGGDSITAMRIAAMACRQGMSVTVPDVFRYHSVAALTNAQRKTDGSAVVSSSKLDNDIPSFSLLAPFTSSAIIHGLDPTYLQGLGTYAIVDILPATGTQKYFIRKGLFRPHESLDYFYMDLGLDVDLERLARSCQEAVDHLPILRTAYATAHGTWWQIVLGHGAALVDTVHVTSKLETECQALCFQDSAQGFHYETVPTRFTMICHRGEGTRLVVRLSHAQYDALSLPIIVGTLLDLYHGMTLRPATDFSTYLTLSHRQRDASLSYWQRLLVGSKLTRMTPLLQCQDNARLQEPERVVVERRIPMPGLPGHITMASLVGSAWALVLSAITGEPDVVYPTVVAGRNAPSASIFDVAGPCINIIPIRAKIDPSATTEQLLGSIQEQNHSVGLAETCDFEDIVSQCTDWPRDTTLDSIFQYQNVEESPTFKVDGVSRKLIELPSSDWLPLLFVLIVYPEGETLRIRVNANTHIVSPASAKKIIDSLCDTVTRSSVCSGLSLTTCTPNNPFS